MELQKDSLVELIVQLKATVHGQPDVARSIMMTHPQLAHAIVKTMAELGIFDKNLFQKTVLAYAQSQAAAQPTAGMPSTAPAPGLAPMYHGPGPAYPPPSHYPPGAQPQMYQAPAPPPAQAAAPAINPALLAAVTDELRQAILHILQMTPEQLALVPPAERGTYIELRRQFGIPS